jgi:hypothetical protein
MEIIPEHLPPVHRGEREQKSFEYKYTVRQVHPLVAVLFGVLGLGLVVLLMVFFFWVGVVALGLAVLGLAVRRIAGFLRNL